MSEDSFWQIVEASRAGFDHERYVLSRERQAARLHELLSQLSVEDLRAFQKYLDLHMDRAYSAPGEGLWAVARDIGGGCSDDSFDDFRNWLISMGREVFEAAVLDPNTVLQVAERAGLGEDVFFEGFQYIPSHVLREKTGKED